MIALILFFCAAQGLILAPYSRAGINSRRPGGPSATCLHATSTASTTPTLAPRKELFFNIVESGLQDRFSPGDIARVLKFCAYARGEATPPVPTQPHHEPCEEYIDGLTAQPWWDASAFDWAPAVAEAAPIMRRELEAVLAQERVFLPDSKFQQTMGAGWTALRLQRLGEWNDDNTRKFPATSRLIQALNIPLAVRGVMFAKQAPGTGVQPHSDGRNFILTAHVGLKVPPGCSITVGGEPKGWTENGVIVLDTSFVHSTANQGEDDRFVLIIDFWHPELSAAERDALTFIYDCRNKFESGRARDIDCPWVKEGRPLTTKDYEASKAGFGAGIANFWSGGGFIKFNPMK